MAMGKRAFVDKLPFITSMGHGPTGAERRALGLKSRGPTRLITDLCVFEPDADTQEMTVVSLHPGVTRTQVEEACGWQPKFAASVVETPPPTVQELDVLRDIQARTKAAHAGQ
jgi:glutaconate CoA-transferase subunit B